MRRTVLLLLSLVVAAVPAQKAEDPLEPNWGTYHDTEQTHALMHAWARIYPKLCRVLTIGKTLRGTPLLVLEITNSDTGPGDSKPAYYYDGNIHSEELTSCEVTLRFAHHVLRNHVKDRRIQRLLGTRTLYVRPRFNPDGADVALKTVHNPRSTPRPYDEDRDGLLDEDPPNDLDGDGHATRMRKPNPAGAWKQHPAVPALMVRRRAGDTEGPFFDVWSEGIDDDKDGKLNEDDVGGIDMNRNFPRNWGQDFEQKGAGPYPLSEPETRATVEFVMAHPNITGAFCGHTNGGFVYRLPSTTSWDDFDRADQRLIEELASGFERTTGQPVRASYTDPRAHRHGTLISWLYWNRGIIGTVPEFWGGMGTDLDGDGRVSEHERYHFDRYALGGAGFAPWKPYDHPTLGKVEIGGWRRRFTSRNPPKRLLAVETRRYIPWMLELAEASPKIVIDEINAEALADDLWRIKVKVRNEGWLPTNLTARAIENQTAKPVRAIVSTSGARLVEGKERTALGHIPGLRDARTPETPTATATWIVKKEKPDGYLAVEIRSEKGGRVKQRVVLP